MRYRWIEHLAQAWDAFIEDVFSCVPEDTKKHIKNARKEFLLAVRSIIDKKIESLEKGKKSEVKKVKVEKA
ncbi:MAG: hypothetical protein GXO57_06935 [Thermodesulfobacteria bacterium]|nr:hypothetical protein [Thermodesulfobacteriota bacterium]